MTAAELRIAHVAFEYIETVARPYVRAGGRLWTKTPGLTAEQPATHLRKLLKPLDDTVPITFTTTAAMTPGATIDREHALPVKRIAVEMIDPMHRVIPAAAQIASSSGGPKAQKTSSGSIALSPSSSS